MIFTEQSAVCIEGVNHYFGEGDSRNQVLINNNIEIPRGQLVVMTGPSGSGKTTLLTLVGALRSVQEGRIVVLGQDLAQLRGDGLVAMRRNIGFIFQMHNLFDSLSAIENVQMAMQLSDCPPADMRARGSEILQRLGLGHRIDHKPAALSGGQRQRVAVARAIVNRPQLILADEPTAALDKESSRIVVNLLKELTQEEGCTVMMVTHDNRILELADRIVNMVDGTIRSDVVLRDALMICEFLRTVEIFNHLSAHELTNIAENMRRRRYRQDEVIIHEGDPGEEFFLISRGGVHVRRGQGETTQHLATLGPGQVFGEHALIVDQPRNATCLAGSDDVELFVLDKAEFKSALQASATFHQQIMSIYFQRQ